ncbi:sensor histidine kinase [Bacteroides thetaiotaomicron]|uniref:sensor histidine kinase n=1 Tax=Bacteroides thetaiotaomicron TaxID=818 RepID=UPI0021659497|nr:HAMP domain-containing sensor histidine kinase [Bacteroides thetaiotaomicron]MCS3196485.1 HAMP domain-containing histidine kinase [Bacteroides thetaiotaomicron]
MVNLKYKYIIACICLLAAFLCGYNLKQWYATNHRIVRHVSLIYSFSKDEVSNIKFEELVRKEFRKQGMEPVFDRFYLDCDCFAQKKGIEHTRNYLEILKNKPLDLILPVGDQATYSLLSTKHRLLSSIPVVACNVHFPDESLVKEYESKKVYVLRDSPDFKRNLEFIKSLQPHVHMEVIYNIDLTPLGYKSFNLLTHVVDRRNVQILSSQSAFPVEYEYKEIKEMVEYYSLMPAMANGNSNNTELTVSLCPFRYIKGNSLLVMMKKSKSEQRKRAFLLDKSDNVALPIVNALNMPSFSCIREGFGEETKIVGGYMATDEISAKAVTDLASRLLNKEKVGMPKIRDLGKEYVLDWKYFSAYSGYDMDNVPKNVRMINYPFYDHYRKELYFLEGLLIFAFILVSFILLRIYRRSQIERQNLRILEEAHKRLTLSADGGQISLWNMHAEYIEFDENFIRLTELKQRKFKIVDFDKYIYPDDVETLRLLTEALYQSPGVRMQRVRFRFDEEKDYQWYELRCRSLKDVQGEMMLAGVMQSIQELVEREHQLVLAKQMAERAELKQSFLNNMSHEIRTPLNAIVGFTNLLMNEDANELDAEEKADMLKIINHNNELLLKLINDIVEISRLDSGNMDFEIKEWNMTEVIGEIYKTYQPLVRASLEFRLELDDTAALPVNMDCLRFTQVIVNFLSNANKFTQNGSIVLGCKVDKKQREICVYVQDSGKGINEKELMMIFDRFYKGDEFEQGSGLGLPICKVIVERLSGRIEVHSEIGVGSCFSVYLSMADSGI